MFYICSRVADCQAKEPATATGVLGKTAVDRRSEAVLLDDSSVHFCEDEPCLDGCLEPEFIGTNCILDRCDLEALAVARGQKLSRLKAATITRVSKRAAATFNPV